MGIPIMRREDTNAYGEYKKNIVILSTTVDVYDGCLGDFVSIQIIDNNKKRFKRRRLCREFFPILDTDELNNDIEVLIHDYINNMIGKKITKEINRKLIINWRQERLAKEWENTEV